MTSPVDLAALLEPRLSAVLGASDRGAALDLIANLGRGGGRVIGINPRRSEVAGVRCVPSAADLPELPDIAAVAVGPARIVEAVSDALAAGIRRFVVPGLGLEDGDAGARAREELVPLLREAGASMAGPNCMGIATPRGPSAWIGTVLDDMREGGVASVVQSGSIGEALISIGPRLGQRAIISSGTESICDAADWLAFFATDVRTRAIGLFLETVRRPAAFEDALRAAAEAGKPVVVLKVGRSQAGARRALAHSGAIVGSQRTFGALCDAYGALQVSDYTDWVEHLEVLGSPRRPRGLRTIVLSNSGGEAELVADLADAAGMPLPELPADLAAELDAAFPFGGAQNPIDYWAVAPAEEIVPAATLACARHAEVDAVLLNVDQSFRFENGERENAEDAARALVAAAAETGTFCALLSTATTSAADEVVAIAAEGGVPVLQGAGAGLRAVAAAARWQPRVRRLPVPVAAPGAPELDGARGPLPELESKLLLARYGVAGTRELRAATPDEAAAAAAELGSAVVVKTDGPAHKEAVGGVALGLRTPDQAREAAQRIGGPVLVAEELRGGVEVICGAVRDPLFGPVVVCGAGGSWAEALAPSARAALAPLERPAALELVAAVEPLAGRLGEAGAGAVADVLVALGRAMDDCARIAEIDVNPLRVAGGGAVALDALVVLDTDPEA